MLLLFWQSHIEKKRVIPDTVIPNKRFLLASVNYGQTTQSLCYASDKQHCFAMITQKSICSCAGNVHKALRTKLPMAFWLDLIPQIIQSVEIFVLDIDTTM